MAARFVSEEFKQKVSELLSFFEEYNIDYDSSYLPNDEDEDTEDEDDDVLIIDEDYVLHVYFPHSYWDGEPTIGELLDVVHDALGTVEFNENKFIGKRKALYSIDNQIHAGNLQ